MDSTKNDREAVAPSVCTSFSLVDPATGKRRVVREMTDQEIARHLRDLGAQVTLRMNRVMREIVSHVQDPSKLSPAINELEQCRGASGMVMVLEYEQNRRANVGALVAV
jgi:hypothetical protein